MAFQDSNVKEFENAYNKKLSFDKGLDNEKPSFNKGLVSPLIDEIIKKLPTWEDLNEVQKRQESNKYVQPSKLNVNEVIESQDNTEDQENKIEPVKEEVEQEETNANSELAPSFETQGDSQPSNITAENWMDRLGRVFLGTGKNNDKKSITLKIDDNFDKAYKDLYGQEFSVNSDRYKTDVNEFTGEKTLTHTFFNPRSEENLSYQDIYNDYLTESGYDPNDSSTWEEGSDNRDYIGIIGDLLEGKYLKPVISGEDINYDDENSYYNDWWGVLSDLAGRNKEHAIDDGTIHPDNLSSDTMTGLQYKIYRDITGTGRDPDTIDPYAIYSKTQEAIEYGFVPHVISDDDWRKMQLQRMSEIPNELANELGNSRNNIFNYTINTGDQSFSGRDFEKNVTTYMDRIKYLGNETMTDDGRNIFTIKDADHTGMTPYSYGEWQVVLDDGNVERHPHGKIKAELLEDGTILVTFPDGLNTRFNDETDFSTNLQKVGIQIAEDGEEPIAWYPDLVLDDGQRISFADAWSIINDDPHSEDPDKRISYDYGPLGLGKPKSHSNGLFSGDILNETWDLLAGSAPYFTIPTGVTLGLSRTASALNGRDPSSLRMDGTSRQLAEDLNDSDYLTLLMANTAMPLTEFGWGRIGKSAITPFNKFFTKHGLDERAFYPWYQHAMGTVGEGLEELPGNVVEAITQNGLGGAYANQVYDEEGNPVYDSAGRPVLDRNTSFEDRKQNFFDDAWDAAASGAWLGGLFGIPSLPSTYVQSVDNWSHNRDLINEGVGLRKNGSKIKNGTADFVYPISEELDKYLDKDWE